MMEMMEPRGTMKVKQGNSQPLYTLSLLVAEFA